MNIVITGGTGLIGRHLIPRLLELGHQITVVTRNPQKASSVLGPPGDAIAGAGRSKQHSTALMRYQLWPENRLLINAGLTSKRASLPKPLEYHAKTGRFD